MRAAPAFAQQAAGKVATDQGEELHLMPVQVGRHPR